MKVFLSALIQPLLRVKDWVLSSLAHAGTTLRYRPGLITGGAGLTHDCGRARGMGYFLEPLVCLALFGKKVSTTNTGPGPPRVPS